MLGNNKSNVIVNYLFMLVFVLKLSGLKGYLKSKINKLWRKYEYKFKLEDADSLKISVFYPF